MPLKVMDSQRMPQGSCLVVHNTRDEGRGTHWTGPIWSKINLASVSSLSLKPAQSPLMTSITSSLTLPVDYLQLLFYFFPLVAVGMFSGPAIFPCSPSQQVIRNAAFFSSRFIFARQYLKLAQEATITKQDRKMPILCFQSECYRASSSVNAYVYIPNGFIFS